MHFGRTGAFRYSLSCIEAPLGINKVQEQQKLQLLAAPLQDFPRRICSFKGQLFVQRLLVIDIYKMRSINLQATDVYSFYSVT